MQQINDLVEYDLKPPSPLTARVDNIDALLQSDAAKDEDSETRKIVKEIENEFNTMLKAMNKRLRL